MLLRVQESMSFLFQPVDESPRGFVAVRGRSQDANPVDHLRDTIRRWDVESLVHFTSLNHPNFCMRHFQVVSCVIDFLIICPEFSFVEKSPYAIRLIQPRGHWNRFAGYRKGQNAFQGVERHPKSLARVYEPKAHPLAPDGA